MDQQKPNYNTLLSPWRMGAGNGRNKKNIEAFYSDRTRILYCSAFRRLQQKAQVFSMETNSSVRSRLTHSLEVSDLGRRLANDIAYWLAGKGWLTDTNIPVVVAIVENACLLHDIGNPPFGHFGESAIQDWAKHQAIHTAPAGLLTQKADGTPEWGGGLGTWMKDFEEFDGNPQGFRTISKLYTDFGPNGLDLTCATLLCGLKYARTTSQGYEKHEKAIKKKAGWFQTESELVETLIGKAGCAAGVRYPLTYIMEAADDIAYCMSDIADGIEKRILTEEEFVRTFVEKWDTMWNPGWTEKSGKKRPNPLPKEIETFLRDPKQRHGFNRDFSVPWSTQATREAVEEYKKHHDTIFAGTAGSLICEDQPMGRILSTINAVCCGKLYPSIEAESIELTGYAVITGILRHYERLLKLEYADFRRVLDGERRDFPVEARLFNRLGCRCVEAYKNGLAEWAGDPDFARREWWLRVHLLIDHISSMTDAYALETYQMLEGIALMRT